MNKGLIIFGIVVVVLVVCTMIGLLVFLITKDGSTGGGTSGSGAPVSSDLEEALIQLANAQAETVENVNQAQADISRIDTTATDAKTAADGNTSSISTLNTDLVRIDNLSSLVSQAAIDADTIATNAQSTVDLLTPQVSANTGNISTNTGNISTNTGNISGISSDISALQSKSYLNARITSQYYSNSDHIAGGGTSGSSWTVYKSHGSNITYSGGEFTLKGGKNYQIIVKVAVFFDSDVNGRLYFDVRNNSNERVSYVTYVQSIKRDSRSSPGGLLTFNMRPSSDTPIHVYIFNHNAAYNVNNETQISIAEI